MHERVRAEISRRISAGEYALGSMIHSESALCEQFGVSRITVRQALASLVHEGLLYKQPGRGTFVRDNKPREPLPREGARSHVIYLLLTNAVGSFMSQLIRGVERVVRKHGYDLRLAIANDDPSQEHGFIDDLLQRPVDGVLIMPVDSQQTSHSNCFDYLRIKDAGIPLLFVDRYLSQLPVGYVVGPDESGMRLLTEHMIAQGYTDIAYIHHAISASSVTERFQGYLGALLAHRLHPSVVLQVEAPRGSRSDAVRGYEIVKKHLASGGHAPRALLACNSDFAIGAFRALKEAGLRVPQDVALAGFDDLPETEVLEVPLTALRVPIEGMGEAAAEHLVRMINGNGNGEIVREKLAGELVVRASCGAPIGTTNRLTTDDATNVLKAPGMSNNVLV